MNLIILHGDDYVKSKIRLNAFIDEAKKRKWRIDKINLKNKGDFMVSINKNPLFIEKTLKIYDNINLLNETDYKWMKENYENEEILIFYSKNKISQSNLKKIPEFAKIEEFDPPKIIFNFLFSLYPGNSKNALKLISELSIQKSWEFIFFMISKHFRDLFWVIKEPSKIPYPSWKVFKLEQQASKFRKQELINIIAKLSEIDVSVKSTSTTLETKLCFWITDFFS